MLRPVMSAALLANGKSRGQRESEIESHAKKTPSRSGQGLLPRQSNCKGPPRATVCSHSRMGHSRQRLGV